jgi:hypothetical protein
MRSGSRENNRKGAKKMVRAERLELSRVAPLEPKSSASTSSATLAQQLRACLPDVQGEQSCFTENNLEILQRKLGWTKGIEPSTAGVTILSSTN